MAKYENNDYQCACAVGYVGQHCEIGIRNRQLKRDRGEQSGDSRRGRRKLFDF